MPPPDPEPPPPQAPNKFSESQEYRPLPSANEPPPKVVAQATTISFIFPKKRTFVRPWSRVVSAEMVLDLESGTPVLVFVFSDARFKVIFLGDERDPHLPYLQAYVDGRLSVVEEKPNAIQIIAELVDDSENYSLTYPRGMKGGGATYERITAGDEGEEGPTGGGEAGGGESEEDDSGF